MTQSSTPDSKKNADSAPKKTPIAKPVSKKTDSAEKAPAPAKSAPTEKSAKESTAKTLPQMAAAPAKNAPQKKPVVEKKTEPQKAAPVKKEQQKAPTRAAQPQKVAPAQAQKRPISAEVKPSAAVAKPTVATKKPVVAPAKSTQQPKQTAAKTASKPEQKSAAKPTPKPAQKAKAEATQSPAQKSQPETAIIESEVTPQAENSPEFRILAALGFGEKLIRQFESSKSGVLNTCHLATLPHAMAGDEYLVTGMEYNDKSLLYLLSCGHRVLNQDVPAAAAQSPSVVILAHNGNEVAQILGRARNLLVPVGVKVFALYADKIEDERTSKGLSQPVDILITTLEGLNTATAKEIVKVDNIRIVVADNLDEMVKSETLAGLGELLQKLRQHKIQAMLFSPNSSDAARRFASLNMEEAKHFDANILEWCAKNQQRQWLYAVPAEQKFPLLLGHLRQRNPKFAVVFANTRTVAEWLTYKLIQNGIKSDVLTLVPFRSRQQSLFSKIATGEINVLVATDAAVENLHFEGLADAINFDVPELAPNYLERLSCLSREAKNPVALTLLCEDYGYHMKDIVELIGFMPATKNAPAEWAQIADKSDMPFDAKGRVKPIWDPKAMAEVRPEGEQRFERPARPEGEQRFERPARPEGERRPDRPHQRPAFETPAATATAATSSAQRTAPRDEASRRGKPSTFESAKGVRRDEKARETIEAALAAARDAAKRRQEMVGMPTGDVKKDVSNLASIAREGITAAFGVLQERVAGEIEKKFPFLSDFAKKAWEAQKGRKAKPSNKD